MDRTERFDENNYEFNSESENGIYLINGFTSLLPQHKLKYKYAIKIWDDIL